MKTNHTQGNWEVKITPGGAMNTKLISVEPSICSCSVKLSNPKEAEANAKLIAAAPELLEACIGLIGILTPKQYSKQFPNIYKKAQEAIKKATE